jgi:molecular chaperone GrpE
MIGLNDELDSHGEPESCESSAEAEKSGSAHEIDELRQKSEEYLENMKRLQAEFENYRKRAAKEREETVQLATVRLVKELLLLADNFERALANSKNPNDSDSQSQGLKMMYWQLMDILKGEGVTEIETRCKLDPFQHEVMTKVDDPGHADDEIIECVQKGYRMKGKVIRPARVIVCRREDSVESGKKIDDDTDHDGSCECEEEIEEDEEGEVN